MALTRTTLSSAITSSDRSCVVASATGIVAGDYMLIDQEFVRVGKAYVSGTTIPLSGRGLNGSAADSHVASAGVVHGPGSEFATGAPAASQAYPAAGRARTVVSYSASGAISLPTPGSDAVAILNGTSTLAMTLANPSLDMDGCLLYVLGNGKSASTVTVSDGFGLAGSGYTVLTFQNAGVVGFTLMASNAGWVVIGAPPITGTSTEVSIAIS